MTTIIVRRVQRECGNIARNNRMIRSSFLLHRGGCCVGFSRWKTVQWALYKKHIYNTFDARFNDTSGLNLPPTHHQSTTSQPAIQQKFCTMRMASGDGCMDGQTLMDWTVTLNACYLVVVHSHSVIWLPDDLLNLQRIKSSALHTLGWVRYGAYGAVRVD